MIEDRPRDIEARKTASLVPRNGVRVTSGGSLQTRVAFVDQQGRKAGGAEESLALLLRYLPKQIDPLAILFEDGAYADRLRGLGIDVEIHQIPRYIKKATREHPGIGSALGIPRSAFELSERLRRERIDLVYTNTIKAHVIGGLAARFAGLPDIAHLRDILEGRSLELVRFALGTCSDRRVAISRAVAASYGLSKTDVIPNPVDLQAYDTLASRDEARAALGIAWNGPLVGIIGRINRWKGHDRFLRIARRVVDAMPAKFVIVGEAIFRDADFEAELRMSVSRLDLEEHVIFVPWQEDPRTAYRAIDLLCNCSTREPFGRSTIEAAAAARPTVCFNDGGAAEGIDDGVTGRAVPAGDEFAFAEAVLGFLRRDDVLAAAGLKARKHAERYRAELHAERVASTIVRVATGPRWGE
jgi:glycosyltransferase involved in cell wall biosynthesis